MMYVEFLELVVVFAIGFFLGEVYLAKRMRDVIEMVAEAADDETEIEVFKLKTTTTADSIFLYDDQDVFICQGKTIEELASLCKQYSNIQFASVLHNDKIVIFMDGVVKETK
jgi:hypothetical protein